VRRSRRCPPGPGRQRAVTEAGPPCPRGRPARRTPAGRAGASRRPGVPTRPPAPHLIAERRGQRRCPSSASPACTLLAEHACGTYQTTLRHAGAGPHAVRAAALAHRVARGRAPGVLGRVCWAGFAVRATSVPSGCGQRSAFGRFRGSRT
jgi:hypothetical protein